MTDDILFYSSLKTPSPPPALASSSPSVSSSAAEPISTIGSGGFWGFVSTIKKTSSSLIDVARKDLIEFKQSLVQETNELQLSYLVNREENKTKSNAANDSTLVSPSQSTQSTDDYTCSSGTPSPTSTSSSSSASTLPPIDSIPGSSSDSTPPLSSSSSSTSASPSPTPSSAIGGGEDWTTALQDNIERIGDNLERLGGNLIENASQYLPSFLGGVLGPPHPGHVHSRRHGADGGGTASSSSPSSSAFPSSAVAAAPSKLLLMQRNRDSYLLDPTDSHELEYAVFREHYEAHKTHNVIQHDIAAALKIVWIQRLYDELVVETQTVPHDSFFLRYLYRKKCVDDEETRRQKLVSRLENTTKLHSTGKTIINDDFEDWGENESSTTSAAATITTTTTAASAAPTSAVTTAKPAAIMIPADSVSSLAAASTSDTSTVAAPAPSAAPVSSLTALPLEVHLATTPTTLSSSSFPSSTDISPVVTPSAHSHAPSAVSSSSHSNSGANLVALQHPHPRLMLHRIEQLGSSAPASSNASPSPSTSSTPAPGDEAGPATTPNPAASAANTAAVPSLDSLHRNRAMIIVNQLSDSDSGSESGFKMISKDDVPPLAVPVQLPPVAAVTVASSSAQATPTAIMAPTAASSLSAPSSSASLSSAISASASSSSAAVTAAPNTSASPDDEDWGDWS